MATAKIEREMAARGKGCLGKAADDEPVFILRGQDIFAASLVRHWANLAQISGAPYAKVDEANELAELMERWDTKKWPD